MEPQRGAASVRQGLESPKRQVSAPVLGCDPEAYMLDS